MNTLIWKPFHMMIFLIWSPRKNLYIISKWAKRIIIILENVFASFSMKKYFVWLKIFATSRSKYVLHYIIAAGTLLSAKIFASLYIENNLKKSSYERVLKYGYSYVFKSYQLRYRLVSKLLELELIWSWLGVDLELIWSWFRVELELIWSRKKQLTQNTISAGTKGRNVTHAN